MKREKCKFALHLFNFEFFAKLNRLDTNSKTFIFLLIMNKHFHPIIIVFTLLFVLGLVLRINTVPGLAPIMLFSCAVIGIFGLINDFIRKRDFASGALHLAHATGLLSIQSRLFFWQGSHTLFVLTLLLLAIGFNLQGERPSTITKWFLGIVSTLALVLIYTPSSTIFYYIYYAGNGEKEINETNQYKIHNKYSYFLANNGEEEKALNYIDSCRKCAERYTGFSSQTEKEQVLKAIEDNRTCIEQGNLSDFTFQ